MTGHPLALLHDEIIGCVDAGFNAVPIFMAAAIPDICSALESENGRTNSELYKSWFNTYLAQKMTLFSADDCYSLRCGLIHQGKLGGMKNNVERVIFLPDTQAFACFANNMVNGTYVYSVRDFCTDILNASDVWWGQNIENARVHQNALHILKLHPNGFENVISGLAVLT